MSPWLKRPENESNLSPLSITNVIGDTVLASSLHAFTACTWKNFIMCTNYISLILHPAFFYPFTFTLLLHFYLIFVWSLPYYLFLISNVLLGQKIVNIYPDTWKKKRGKKNHWRAINSSELSQVCNSQFRCPHKLLRLRNPSNTAVLIVVTDTEKFQTRLGPAGPPLHPYFICHGDISTPPLQSPRANVRGESVL